VWATTLVLEATNLVACRRLHLRSNICPESVSVSLFLAHVAVPTSPTSPRRNRSFQYSILVPVDAQLHPLTSGRRINQNGATHTTPPSFKIGSRKQFMFSVFSFSFAVSSAQLPASFFGDTVHFFQPFRSLSNLGTSILLNSSSILSLASQVPRSRSFKTRAHNNCSCHVSFSQCQFLQLTAAICLL
jgi:hypothetical protein